MAFVTIMKYIAPALLFFYGTVVIHLLQETSNHKADQKLNVMSKTNRVRVPIHEFETDSTLSQLNSKWNQRASNKKHLLELFHGNIQNTNKSIKQLKSNDMYDNNIQKEFEKRTTVLSYGLTANKLKVKRMPIESNKENLFQQVGNYTFVLSAFYDNRGIEMSNEQCIQVIAITKLDFNENLICSMKNERFNHITKATAVEMSDNHEKKFGGVTYICKIPPDFGSTPPKSIYLQSVRYQTDSFSKVTNRFISQPAMQVHVFYPPEISHHLKIPDAGGVHSSNYQDTLENERNKTLQHNRQKLKSLINTQGRQLQKTNLQIQISNKELSSKISVCVSPLFGSVTLTELIQFVEIHLILGASHFFIYKMNVSSEVGKMLNYYESKGIITLLDWVLPTQLLGSSSQIWYNGQVVTLQDCLYRNIGRFQYTAFLDIDEVIIPYKAKTLTEMLQQIENNEEFEKSSITHFSFQSAFFPPDISTDNIKWFTKLKGNFNKLSFLTNIHRNDFISSIRTKVVIKPEHVEQMGIHHVSKLHFSSKNFNAVAVATDTALIHHYRKCTEVSDEQMHCGKFIEDTSLLKYADVLLNNYEAALSQFLQKL